MSSFFKKLGEQAKNTASTIGTKSANLVETGKLKLAKNQLEGKINDKKQEIGDFVYGAYKAGSEPDGIQLKAKFEEIDALAAQISDIDAQLAKESAAPPPAAAEPAPAVPETAPAAPEAAAAAAPAAKFCPNCGAGLESEAKFCANCGKPQ